MDLTHIKETLSNYPVKNLKWSVRDNVIIGFVLDPIMGLPNINEGYRVVTWRKNGTITQRYGGKDRTDLNLKM